MYNWLRKECENRSVAELSIVYSLTAAASFVGIVLLFAFLTTSASGADDKSGSSHQGITFLVAVSLWLFLFVWLWVGLVRTLWKWGSERLGIAVFRYLQIVFFVMFVLTMLLGRDGWDEWKLLLQFLLVFDAVIVCLIFNFLFLAWFARCKIPLRAYCEIGSIIAMVIFQVWILT